MSEDHVLHLVGKPMEPPLSREEAEAQLDEITDKIPLTHWAGMCLHPEDVAVALGVDLATVEGWQQEGVVVAIHHKGEDLLPMRQFVGARPVEGLSTIIRYALGNHRTAWDWLMRRHHECDGRPPIEFMREGRIEQVLELSTRSLAPLDFGVD